MQLEEEPKAARNEPEAFAFYLSAFLTATRSVQWVLQKERGIKEGRYQAWLNKWKANQGEDERVLLDRMIKQRDAEVHQVGTDTTQQIEQVPMQLVERVMRQTLPLRRRRPPCSIRRRPPSVS
jgi:hypothetical protein